MAWPLDVGRRDFIRIISAPAGATLLAQASPAPAALDLAKKVRIGVVGGGFDAAFQ